MSASLVGSEMCIRDSPNVQRRKAASWCGWRDRRPCRCALQHPQSALRTCLLYTSDAADDM
eukprot:6605826-Alexandrium_andersonii.AAC.1